MNQRPAQRRRSLTRLLQRQAQVARTRFRPRLEPLEDRRLLVAAVDLASITGLVFDDFTGNGFDDGEQVAGASLDLYQDDGDGQFEPGGDDMAVRMTMTSTDGTYAFERLVAGGYFVLQPEQPTLGLLQQVSNLITISSDDVKGQINTTIDSFDTTMQTVNDETNDNQPVTSSVAAIEAIGGERDLFVNKTSVNGAIQLGVDSPLLPNQLTFDSFQTGAGERRITWDGPDNDALIVDDAGLQGVNLTTDALGVQLQIRADLAGGNAIVRIYSDDGVSVTSNRFSTATIPIPATMGTFLSAEFIPFSDFIAEPSGGADFTNVGAIELEITGAADVNGAAELVGAVGVTERTQDFSNFETANLSLGMTADDLSPVVGQDVTFTISVSNAGPNNATGVTVTDALPSGIEFESFSTANGSYDSTSGVWNIGSIAAGASASLSITGTIVTVGSKTNTAEVTSVDQFDSNSTPNNNDPGEDDQASVTVTPETINLSLDKTVNNPAPNLGETITFTIAANNAGPDTATNVEILDLLPSGLTLVSPIPSRGNYNTSTGIWTIDAIASGETVTLQLRASVDGTGSRTNTAEVIAADQSDINSIPGNNDPAEDDQDSVTITTPVSDLSLTKQVDNATPNVGNEIFFTITVGNAGPDPATGVMVADLLPVGLTPLGSTVNAGVYSESTGIWDIGNVAVGASPTLSIRARVDSNQTTINTAQISAADQADPDSQPNNNVEAEDDQASVTIDPPTIDLSLNKTINDPRPNVGDEIIYTIDLANAGPDGATGIIVSDPLPVGLTFSSATEGLGNYDETTGNWTVPSLTAGASTSLELRAFVNTSNSVTNTARVQAADQFDSDSIPGNDVESEDDQSSVTFSLASADLSLTKTVNNGSPNVGDDVTFTVTVNNSGPDVATGISILDQLPAGVTLQSANESLGSYDASSGIWSIESLAIGGNATLTLVATANSNEMATNTAEIVAADQTDPDSIPGNGQIGEDDIASASLQGQQIDLALSQSISDSLPNVGSEVTFFIVITNSGPSNATGVVVTDSFPAGVTLVRATPSSGSFNTSNGQWTVGSLNRGQQETLELVVRVDQILSTATNVAQVTAANQPDFDSIPANNVESEDDQQSVDFRTPVADLALTKTTSNSAPNVGEALTFDLSLLNEGPDSATEIEVLDLLPSGLEFVSSSLNAGTYDPINGTWSIASLTSGATATLTINAVVRTQGEKVNTARVMMVNEADPDSIPGNNVESEDDQSSVSIAPPVIDLSLGKTASPTRPAVGETVTFTLTANNAGPSDASGVAVTDTLPGGVTFVSADTASGSFNSSTGVWNIGSLAAGASATLELTTTLNSAQSQTNTAEVTAANEVDSDSVPNNGNTAEDDFASVTITPASADLSLTKTADDTTPNVGQQVTFTLTAANAGPDAAGNITIRDVLPTGLTFISSTPSIGSYDPVSGIWSLPSLASGASSTLSINATVGSIGDKTNTAEILTSDQADPDSVPGNGDASEDDQDSVTLSPQLIDLALTKMIDDSTPSVGDTIAYTLGLSNDGPTTATGVSVSDQLPSGVTFTSATASQGSYDESTGIWTVGTVAVGDTPTLQINVTVNNTGGDTNTAEVSAADQTDADSVPGNGNAGEDDQASVTFTTEVADLSLSKSVDDPTPDQNQNVNFTLRLDNAGPNTATGVVVTDLLPSGLTFVGATPSLGSYDATTGAWSISELSVGTPATLLIEASVNSSTTTTNIAEVTSGRQFDPDSTPGNGATGEDDIDSVEVTPPVVDISVAINVDNDEPLEGDVITITFDAGNAGPANASGVVANVAIPAGLTILSTDPATGSYDPATGVWNIGSIAAGNTAQLTMTARVDVRDQKTIGLEVVATDQFDIDSTPGNGDINEDDQTELILRAPGLLSARLFLSR